MQACVGGMVRRRLDELIAGTVVMVVSGDRFMISRVRL